MPWRVIKCLKRYAISCWETLTSCKIDKKKCIKCQNKQTWVTINLKLNLLVASINFDMLLLKIFVTIELRLHLQTNFSCDATLHTNPKLCVGFVSNFASNLISNLPTSSRIIWPTLPSLILPCFEDYLLPLWNPLFSTLVDFLFFSLS